MVKTAPRLAIGVDIGGTTIKGSIVSGEGKVVTSVDAVPTPKTGAEDVTRAAAEMVHKLAREYPGVDLPIGVCAPGIIDEAAGVGVLSANLGWKDAPLLDLLSNQVGRPVTLGHDVRAGALAEALWGVRSSHCLYVAIGTGIASGLVVNSRPAPGAPWVGEIGQIPVEHPDHPGQRIELEKVASAAGMVNRAIEAGLLAVGSGARDLQDLAESNDPRAPEAAAIMTSSLELLGRVLATVLHQTGSVPVVIGGGVSKGGEAVLAPIRVGIESGCTIFPAPGVVAASFGSESQVLGAAALAFLAQGTPVLRPIS